MFTPTFDEQKFLEQRIRELRRELETNLERYTVLKAKGGSSPRPRAKESFSGLMWRLLSRS